VNVFALGRRPFRESGARRGGKTGMKEFAASQGIGSECNFHWHTIENRGQLLILVLLLNLQPFPLVFNYVRSGLIP
jgi:hypothetical protein